MNESIIRRAFEEKRQEIRNDMEFVYGEIAEAAKSKPVEWVAKEITIAEASRLNAYCQSLEQTLRKTVCARMTEAGVSDNEVNIIWARAKRKAGTAGIRLCKEERQVNMQQNGRDRTGESKTQRQQNGKGSGPAILASGAAVEIVGWVFVPGLGKAAALVKGVGLVIMAAGAYKTYEESREKPRIKISAEASRKEYGETRQVIDSICDNQCKLNTSILCEWLDAVRDAVLEECGNS